jgi:hypothetical protein
MSITYHYYSATVLNAPIAQLGRDLYAILNVSQDTVRAARRATGSAAAALAEQSQPGVQLAIQLSDTTVLEEVIDRVSGMHALTYRSTACAPEIAEYVATCSLQRMVDAPNNTFVEWMREYRPAALTDNDLIRAFVSTLVDQDQAIASWFAVTCGSAEVLSIDYTIGDIYFQRP